MKTKLIAAVLLLLVGAAPASRPATQPADTYPALRKFADKLLAQVAKLQAENAALRAENESLRAQLVAATQPTTEPSDDSGKTNHVNGYTRKNGTYVAPYDRRPPRR